MSFRFVQFWFMSSFLNFRPNGCHYKLGQWVFHFTFGNSPNSSFVKSGKIGKKHPKRRSYENHLITIGNGEMIVWTLSTIYFTLLFRIDTFDLIRGSSEMTHLLPIFDPPLTGTIGYYRASRWNGTLTIVHFESLVFPRSCGIRSFEFSFAPT